VRACEDKSKNISFHLHITCSALNRITGVAHTEDVFYLFNSSAYQHGLMRSDQEYSLSQILTDMFANYASTGYEQTYLSDKDRVIINPPITNQNDLNSAFKLI
jgi:hypothetical protein